MPKWKGGGRLSAAYPPGGRMPKVLNVGLDVGSTTVKIVALDENGDLVYSFYERHLADIFNAVERLLSALYIELGNVPITIGVTGSSGMAIAESLELPFVQEVYAASYGVERYIPQANVAIELGGEDAKITYWGDEPELRMNGTCAGGTGAFIDQMASLLQTDAAGLNDLAKSHKQIYPVASRCGVFAKTDIQPLLNEGADKADIAASIFQAVVNQTIAGLACGKPIRGKVAFMGGPLFFLPELRQRFIETLKLKDEDIVVPEHGQYFVAKGAALACKDKQEIQLKWLTEHLDVLKDTLNKNSNYLEPLFNDHREYQEFCARHDKYKVERAQLSEHRGAAFLGIDVGSTTTKLALIDKDGRLLYSFYDSNGGSPLNSATSALKRYV